MVAFFFPLEIFGHGGNTEQITILKTGKVYRQY